MRNGAETSIRFHAGNGSAYPSLHYIETEMAGLLSLEAARGEKEGLEYDSARMGAKNRHIFL